LGEPRFSRGRTSLAPEETRPRHRLFEMFKRLTESANDAVIVADPDAQIVYWNRAATTILGHSREEALGEKVHELIAPERHRDRFAEAFSPRGAGGRDSTATPSLELTALRKDGREIPVELSLSSEDLRGGWFAVGILRDITQRKETEAALYEAKERAEQLYHLVPSAIITVDADSRITSANENALTCLGYTEEQLVGQHCSLFAQNPCDGRCGLFDEHVEKPILGKKCHFLTKDGDVVTIVKNADLLHDRQGNVIGGIESFVDITYHEQTLEELKEARLAALESTRTKTEFLANMSHEIRTPMNAIIGMTGLLLDSELTDDQLDFVETIRRGSENLLAIINDILDFSKIESGKLELEAQKFDLRTCIEDALDLLSPQAADKGLDLVYEMLEGTPDWVVGDDTRLRQILVNLLSNGVKFTGRGDVSVLVGSREIDPGEVELVFTVRDTGIGIPADRMDRLFQSFSQVDASTTRHYGGTGLGLAICRHLCDLMGGRIWCESEVGKGTKFHFTVMMEAAEGPRPAFLERNDPILRGQRVLIVDDNERTREVLARLLASWGMVPHAVGSAEDALETVRFGERFDAALVDASLSPEDGSDLGRGLGLLHGTGDLPVVLLTPVGQADGPRAAGESPVRPSPDCAGHVPRPVKPQRLHATLAGLFGDADPEARQPEEPASWSPRDGQIRGIRILVAEDNPVNQMVVQRILERLGYRAEFVANGREVLEALKRQHYDVILMDVQMPWMDGLQATREIRARQWAGGQPHIIAVTANAMQQDRENCLEAGMDDYLAKPVRLEQLADALERAARDGPAPPLPRSGPAKPISEELGAIDREMLEELLGEEVGSSEVLKELVGLFAETMPGLIGALDQAVEEKDAPLVRQHAHSLKGSAATLGAANLAEYCKELEFMGRDDELDDAPLLLLKIEREFVKAAGELKAICAG
jgi:PAS domain S-box-containing protein